MFNVHGWLLCIVVEPYGLNRRKTKRPNFPIANCVAVSYASLLHLSDFRGRSFTDRCMYVMYVYVLLVGGKVHRQVGVVNVSHAMFDRNTGRRSLCICAVVSYVRLYDVG